MKFDTKYAVVYEFFCIVVISFTMGVGIGWLQSALAFRSLTFSESGVIIGALCSTLLGPIVYYSLLRNNVDTKAIANLIVLCWFAGVISALIFGWISWLVTPLVLILGALKIKENSKSKKPARTE